MKTTAIILILSFMHYCIGCYTATTLNEKKDFQDLADEDQPIYVTTNRGVEYFYPAGKYFVACDTIFGEGRLNLYRKADIDTLAIAFNDIATIEYKEIDTGLTVANVLIPATVLVALGFGIFYFLYDPGIDMARHH